VQVVITECDYTFHNGKLLHHWNVQLLGTGRVVARIDQIDNDRAEFTTYGDHPGGNRYQTIAIDNFDNRVLAWARRRFNKEI